ncbi:MAG TPA: outer membrane beta-barrel protein [Rickettsiales bacterium]|nr:outer membrane beta-barrel protein [Rickettsiales bacterium]
MRPCRIGCFRVIASVAAGIVPFLVIPESVWAEQQQEVNPDLQSLPSNDTPAQQQLLQQLQLQRQETSTTPVDDLRKEKDQAPIPDYVPLEQKQSTTPDDVLTVRRRAIEDNLPIGVKAGGFLISPGIELQTAYDDNIFLTPSGKKSDWITDVKPALGIQSNWERNAIFLGAEGDFGFYRNNDQQSFSDYGALASGQYDIAQDTYVIVGASSVKRHQELGAVANSIGQQPVSYKTTAENVEFVRSVAAIKLDVTGQNQDISLSGGIPSGFAGFGDVLDRNDKSAGVTIKYETMPDNNIFVSTLYDRTRFSLPSGPDQTSAGTNNKLGYEFSTPRGIAGSVFGGYLYRTYEEGTSSTRKPYLGFNLGWTFTDMTKLSLFMDKDFNDETVEGAAGVVHTIHKVSLEQKLSLSLTGTVFGGMDNVDYVGGDPAFDRNTKLYYSGINFQYKLAEGIGLKPQYQYSKRTSEFASDNYTDNRVYLSLLYMY